MGQFTEILSDEIFDLHEEGIDDMIESDMAEIVTIYYPPKIVDCPLCDSDGIGNKPSTFAIDGRPIPIPGMNGCGNCGGTGKIQEETYDTIRGLVYWDIKPWKQFSNNKVELEDGFLQVTTYFSNLPQVLQGSYFIVSNRAQPSRIFKYNLSGEPIVSGFRGKYIILTLRRS